MEKSNIEDRYISILANYPDILSIEDLQHIFNIGRTQAYKLVNDKHIISFRMGRTHKIPKTNVINYIKQFEVA